MKNTSRQIESEYRRLTASLTKVGWLSHGYVQNRGPGAGGPCYQWTRKEKAKTVSVALSKAQYEWMRTAITNWQHVQATLMEMEKLSRQFMFTSMPNPPRRKRLTKKTMGTI